MDNITREYGTPNDASASWVGPQHWCGKKANSSNDTAVYGHYFTWTAINETGQYAGFGPGKICPEGFRLPDVAELLASFPALIANGACEANALNKLSLPLADYRPKRSTTTVTQAAAVDTELRSYVWSRTAVSDTIAERLSFTNSSASIRSDRKFHGYSVRCIQD